MVIKKLLTICFLWVGTIYALADNIEFKAEAQPSSVETGQQFRLSYSVNTLDATDIRIPAIEHFDILYGPARSQNTSIQIINGKQTSSQSITFTYRLFAKETGRFTIPPATITIKGKKYKSNAVTVEVVSEGKQKAAKTASEKTSVGKNDVFLRMIVNKTKIREQEGVLVSYKLYSLVNLELQNKSMPEFTGFHAQEVETEAVKSWNMEQYQGKTYRTIVLEQYVLFPQQSGQLTIPSATYDIVAHIANPNRSDDPFDSFFGGDAINYVKMRIKANPQTLQVIPIENKPANFSGGVGNFSATATLQPKQATTGDAVTLSLQIKGNGNLKLMQTPALELPKEFEVYEPKINTEIRATAQGVVGTKTIEYVFVPRYAGTYEIPSISFTYYDVNSQSFKTVNTPIQTLEVKQGKGGGSQTIADYTNQQDVKVLGSDIQFIRLGDTSYRPHGHVFFGTWGYKAWYIIGTIGFLIIFFGWRKQRMTHADVIGFKHKNANKMALKRMKKAYMLLKIQDTNAFYTEVLRALWGYVSDKLNIPVAELNKENITTRLESVGVEKAHIDAFIHLLNDCELAHYVSGQDHNTMDKVYNDALGIMEKMEENIKNKR